jgi:TolA-binding protein
MGLSQQGCNYVTYSTVERPDVPDSLAQDIEPDFSKSLDFDFQDFTSYLFMGNRIENFSAYFNKYFIASEDFDLAFEEYRTSFIATYNRRLDSLGVTPPVPPSVKEKLDKSIERASKIIQFHKNSKYIDDAVLTIGKAYYYQTDYINSERKFNEFLSRLSTSDLTDEALLFLGRTKIKLSKQDEGQKILKALITDSDDAEIRSLASRELGILAYNGGNLKESVNYFKQAIEFSKDSDRKAENQFILARLSSAYKPETAAAEFRKVLDYSPDFDLTFFARLNYAKGLIRNKDFSEASDELASMRKKYRDFKDFTPLIDLEMANNLYEKGDIGAAKQKYYEVIVQHANTPSASDAYYFLGKDLETKEKDYLNALVNYRKATQENSLSEFFPESSKKAKTFEKYFTLLGDIKDTTKVVIPENNPNVERYRAIYNEEKGIEQLEEQRNKDNRGLENTNTGPDDGTQRGDGKGKPGGLREVIGINAKDTIENPESDPTRNPDPTKNPDPTGGFNPGKVNQEKSEELKREGEEKNRQEDSLNALGKIKEEADKENKIYDSYYELAELFMYEMNMPDSAKYYLKLLIGKFPEPARKAKAMFMLGSFYRTNREDELATETLSSIIAEFPATVYARESRAILNRSTVDISDSLNQNDDLLTKALLALNGERYPEAVNLLREFATLYPNDSLSAKALYGIGWIYQNRLLNKDSALAYYNDLKLRFPESPYYANIAPTLDYYTSLEPKESDSTGVNKVVTDSLNINNSESGEENPPQENMEVKVASPGVKLSQQELEILLMKGDSR